MADQDQKIVRAVIDTNHIMSAILSSKGASSKLIDWLAKEEDYYRLLMTQPIWDEYQGVKIVRVRKFLKVLEKTEKSRQQQ